MRAAVLQTIGAKFAVENLVDPEPKTGEVLVKVAACGVCHSDLHVVHGSVGFPTPCVLGHEVSGVIEAIGPDTKGFRVGQAVVGTFIMPCGTCRHCANGHEELCETFFQFNRLSGHLYDGTSRLGRANGEVIAQYSMGGLAERCVAPVGGIHPLPEGIDLLDAAILGCSGFTAIGAVRTTGQLRVGKRWRSSDAVVSDQASSRWQSLSGRHASLRLMSAPRSWPPRSSLVPLMSSIRSMVIRPMQCGKSRGDVVSMSSSRRWVDLRPLKRE